MIATRVWPGGSLAATSILAISEAHAMSLEVDMMNIDYIRVLNAS